MGPETHCALGENHVVTEVFNANGSSLQTDHFTPITGSLGAAVPNGFQVGAEFQSSGIMTRFANFQWFGGVFIGRVLTATETSNCQTFFSNKAGLSL
jgi:hypothetical protein